MADRMDEIIDKADEWQGHQTMMGHPKGLFYLFFAELWERFSFYGMRALLTLYLINELFADLADGKEFAYGIYAAYGSLVYFTPAIGGMIADRLIGHKNSIMLGGLLMTLGHFTMAFEDKTIFFLSLGLLIIGNGFFKPNISTMVGGLYKQGDAKRDAGFTIFYMGINIGAFIAPLVCGWLGASYGWHYGFGAAGIGMLAGVIVFWNGSKNNVYGNQGEQPAEFKDKKYFGLLNIKHIVYILAFASAPLFAFLVKQNSYIVFPDSPLESGLMTFLLFALLILVIIFLTYTCIKSDKVTRERLIVVALLTFFITIFWSFFEQAGSSLTVFAQDHVNLIGLNAAQTNSINPGYIMIFAIPFSMMWVWLDKKRLNPNTPMKFGLGIAQLGLGFLIFAMSSNYMDSDGMVAMSFLMLGYLFITTGELFVSPVGLSKVTELSPAKLVAFMMGVWFLSSAFAHHISGIISKLTIGGDGHGDTGATVAVAENWLTSAAKSIAGTPAADASEGAAALFNYTTVFGQIAIISFIFAGIAILLSPLIKKMMHGIK
jgi:POT family proton-dependent oligopeptide transporter